MPERNTTTTYVLTATITNDTVTLSGGGLVGDTLSVPRGTDAIVTINDATGYYLYASIVPPGGARAITWERGRGLATSTFNNVIAEIANVVYAANTTAPAKVKYGPVLKIKPQG